MLVVCVKISDGTSCNKLLARRPPVYDLSSFRATVPAAQNTSLLVSAVILAQVTLLPEVPPVTHFSRDQERRQRDAAVA